MSVETGLKIKHLREHRNYTQQYMSEKLELSQNAYSKIENGTTKLTVDRLEEIAKILDVPVESILNNEKQVFNFENNRIDKFYGYIENLHEENKELLNFLQQQNEKLTKLIEVLSTKI